MCHVETEYTFSLKICRLCEIIHKRQITFYMRLDAMFRWLPLRKTHDKLIHIVHSLTERVFRTKIDRVKDRLTQGDQLHPIYPSLMTSEERDEDHGSEIEDDAHLKHTLDEAADQERDANLNDVGEKNRLAFLDLMIESRYCGEQITEEEIKEEVDTIMFEGHDTVAAAASFVLCVLGCHPRLQQRVFEEQHDIFGDVKRAACLADVLQMNYLERVILETLRLYPPVPIIAREVHEDVELASQPLVIPAGATVAISPLQLHRRGDLYPNPLKFDPDNFLPEKTQSRNFYSFIPFAAGPRSCVGRKYAMLKLKILLSTILRNYRVRSPVLEDDFKLQGDIILKRADGFRLFIEPR